MTLLSAVQAAARKLGVVKPTSLVGNDDEDAELLLEIAREEGFVLSQRCFWKILTKEVVWQTVDGEDQGELPEDFDAFVPETLFNRTQRRALEGPVDAAEWQLYKAGLNTILNPSWRMRGRSFLMAPAQTAGHDIAFEYTSAWWARGENGVEQETFLSDTDTWVWPEEILKQGIIWRWRARKGLEHETDRLAYERMVVDRMLRDGGKSRASLAPRSVPVGRAAIPDYNTIKV